MKTFKITISKDCYTSKPDKKKEVPKMHWIPVEATAYDIMNYTMNGYSITGDYGFTTEFHRGRTQANWLSSPFIYIDIDNSTLGWDKLCCTMINRNDYLKPTYIYTTFSHGLEGKGNRYRLVYVFDEAITNSDLYEKIASHYNQQIIKIFNFQNDEVDECNKTINQAMHGTHKHAFLARGSNTPQLTYLVGLLSPISDSDNCHINKDTHTSPNTYNDKKRKNTEVTEYFSKEERILLANTSYTDYINNHFTDYYIYRDNWDKLGDTAKQKDVISVMPKLYWDKETQSRKPYKLHDGHQRKKKLKTVCRKIRAIKPNITKDELLYNIVYWMYNYISQDYDQIKWKEIIDIVNSTLNESVEDYLHERLKWLSEPEKVVRNPYVKVEKKRRVKSDDRDIEFSKLNDTSINNVMKTMHVSKRTAYRIKEKNEEKVNSKELVKKYMEQGLKAKEIMEATGLKKTQVYHLIKLIREAGATEVNIEININNNLEDNSINIIGNEALKYFKDEESMKEFLNNYQRVV